jgi:hypothetical protein
MPKELAHVWWVILFLMVGCTPPRNVQVGGSDAGFDGATDGAAGGRTGTGGWIDAGGPDVPGTGGVGGVAGMGGAPGAGGHSGTGGGGIAGTGGATGVGGATGTGGSCQTPRTLCTDACVDETSDPANCGTCGKACTAPAGGTPICSARACDFTCPGGKKCGTTACVGASQCCTVSDCSAPTGGTVMCVASACVPACPTGQTVCGNACLNLAANDAANCGRCGRSCLGGTCSAGVCQPVSLGGANGGRFNEAGSAAIFASGFIGAGAATRIGTMPKAGATANNVFLLTNPDVAASIALDPSGMLYFVDNDTIRKVPFTDGAVPAPSGASAQIYPAQGVDNSGELDRFRTDSILFGVGSDLQLTGGRLVFVTQSIPAGSHLLKSITSAGAGVVTLVPTGFDGAFATQGGNAFFYQTPAAASAFIGQIDAAGATTPIHLANIISGRPNAMTSDGTYVVFATGGVLQRMKTGLDLQVPETIYSGAAAETVMGALADATNFYWIVDTSLGTAGSAPCSSVHIYKKPKAEAATVAGALIGSLVDPSTACASGELTQDATAIYFQFSGGPISGPIYEVAK